MGRSTGKAAGLTVCALLTAGAAFFVSAQDHPKPSLWDRVKTAVKEGANEGVGRKSGQTSTGFVNPIYQMAWDNKTYTPEILDGATHFRWGYSGHNTGFSVDGITHEHGNGGIANCDMAYMWAAKSGESIDPSDVNWCVGQELIIAKSNDRSQALDYMNKRIAQFKQTDLFYIRQGADPVRYNSQKGALEAYFHTNSDADGSYFNGQNFNPVDGRRPETREANQALKYRMLISTSPEITSLVAAHQQQAWNMLVFRVLDTRKIPTLPGSYDQEIRVDVVAIDLAYMDNGQLKSIGFDKRVQN